MLYRNMKHVKFQPWTGKNYRCGFNGLRTLVLGESHYESLNNSAINDSPDETVESIQEQVNGDWSKAFWTKIATALTGQKPTLDDKKQFWDSVAYYNYIQESAGFGPRVRPAAQSWEISKVPFKEVLEELKPDFIVALGYRLWDMLPDLDGHEGPKIESVPLPRTWIYPHSRGNALLFTIMHPSSGFSPPEWHKHILVAQGKAKDLLMAAGTSDGATRR
jgi:hypothetical protein